MNAFGILSYPINSTFLRPYLRHSPDLLFYYKDLKPRVWYMLLNEQSEVAITEGVISNPYDSQAVHHHTEKS